MSFSITPSHIIEYLFCPRFTYYEYVLRIPQYEDRNFKVKKGRETHKAKQEQNPEYLRRRIGVKKKYIARYLTNDSLRGEVDEVLLLEDGSMAPLDYKFARYEGKIYNTYKTQLYCYALLIESNFKRKVHKGFLVYTRSQHKLIEIPIEDKQKQKVLQDVQAIKTIILKNIYPKATRYKKKCVNCTYRNICIK